MKLKQLREKWERGWEPKMVLPVIIDEFKKLFVILGSPREPGLPMRYKLHRYFQTMGDCWDVSVDVTIADSMDACASRIQEDLDLADLYSKLGRESL